MLLNCFDLISHFLSEMKTESKQTHARGLPYEGILRPGALTVWEVPLHLFPPWFPGRRAHSPLARFSGKACSKLVLKAELCGGTVLQGFRTWWEQFLPPACWKPALLCRNGRSQIHGVSVFRSFSAGGYSEGVCDSVTMLDIRQNVGGGYARGRVMPTGGEICWAVMLEEDLSDSW